MAVDRFTLMRLDAAALARGGRPFALRSLAAGVAVAALFVTYASTFGVRDLLSRPFTPPQVATHQDHAAFAERFAATVLLTQFGLAVVMVPALVSDCIARDRERGTLDLVLTTDLTDAEIVWGRLISRLLPPTYAVFALLPVLALAQLFGGVSMRMIVDATLVILGTIVALGGLSVWMSCLCHTAQGALVASVMMSIPIVFVGGATLVLMPSVTGGDPTSFPGQLFLLFAVGGLNITQVASRSLRTDRPTDQTPTALLEAGFRQFSGDELPAARPPQSLPPAPADDGPPIAPQPLLPRLPPITGDPILWKELNHVTSFGGRTSGKLIAPLVALATLCTFGFASPVAAGLLIFFHAVGSIVREREHDTLTALRLLPGGATAVVRAKWLGSLAAANWLLVVVIGATLGGLALMAHGPLALIELTLVLAVDAAFLATAGLTISAACRTTRAANLCAGVAVAAMTLGAWLATVAVEQLTGAALSGDRSTVLMCASSPLLAWVIPTCYRSSLPESAPMAVAIHLSAFLGGSFVLAVACQWLMSRDDPAPKRS